MIDWTPYIIEGLLAVVSALLWDKLNTSKEEVKELKEKVEDQRDDIADLKENINNKLNDILIKIAKL